MPTPKSSLARIERALPAILSEFGTPCYVYDEQGILERGAALKHYMRDVPGYRQWYAVKAWNNPANLRLQQSMGFGFDCSSMYEMHLMEQIGAQGRFILTSNNSRREWFDEANHLGGIINLDDISLIGKVREFPEMICFRLNPGRRIAGPRVGLQSFGKPWEQKYGIMWEELASAYSRAKACGARHFGIHMMIGSNCLEPDYFINVLRLILKAATIAERATGIPVDFADIGGGFGIPYRPKQRELDMAEVGERLAAVLAEFKHEHGYAPALWTEMGRWMTGPFGVLVASAINRKDIYQIHVGLDVGMNGLMRHGMYGSYHHAKVVGAERRQRKERVNLVGQICENIDRLATGRLLPVIRIGDTVLVQDAGAHGIVMCFNYNGTTRPQEVMLRQGGKEAELIRRAETIGDLDATLNHEPKTIRIN
ncbi:diaminopimelate decarboxylase [Patescibacteria group bacterium]|nr:diaminopimelate decarboxylase [Patescibacteria group bacterium]